MEIGGPAWEPFLQKENLSDVSGADLIDRLPLCFAISADRKAIVFDDCVDYVSRMQMSRNEILSLADEFRKLADLMAS